MARKRSQIESVVDQAEAEENKLRRKRKKKKRNENSLSLASNTFKEIYTLTSEVLGQGAYAVVQSCSNKMTGMVYAVKIIEKILGYSRARVLREIELNYKCQGHKNIIQLIEFFEEEDKFYLVFEKANGGQLTDYLAKKGAFTEDEARNILKDLATALAFLHQRGVAHRDIKPENILCSHSMSIFPIKICDFDLGSAGDITSTLSSPTTPLLTSPVGSAEFMAPEIVRVFVSDNKGCVKYDKQCDIWSLGVLLYILISGSAPFQGDCGKACGWDQGQPCEDCMELLFKNIYRGRYFLESDRFRQVSKECKDLIRKLLAKDPNKRMRAEEVLDHPWLASNEDVETTKCISLPPKEAVETVKGISEERVTLLQLSSPEESKIMRRRRVLQTKRRERPATNRTQF